MRRVLWAVVIAAPLLALLAFGLRGNPDAVASPLLNKPAPTFTRRTLDDRILSLSALRGRPVILNFWASWCPPCRTEHAALRDAWRRYRGKATFVGVLFKDSPDGARGYMAQYGGRWPSIQDPDQRVAIGYGVAGPPETYFIDSKGIVRFKVIGPVSLAILNRYISRLLGRT